MARGKRMSEKIQVMVNRLLGEPEPKFTPFTSQEIDLIRGLNYYAHNAKSEHSKEFAIEWANENMPAIVPGLCKQKSWMFNNIGFILRMVKNGFILDDARMKQIQTKLIQLSTSVDSVKEKQKVVVVRKVITATNKVLEEFDYAVDDVLKHQTPRSISFGTDKKDHAIIVNQCDKILKEMEEAPEYFSKDSIQPMKKFLNAVKKQLNTMIHAVKQQRIRKIAPKKINPTKMVSKMSFNPKDEKLGLVSLHPKKLVGAKQAIVYNTKKRLLMYFKAANDDGFMVSGSTLKNYDLEKSIFKKIRKPENMIEEIKDQTFTVMRKFLNKIKGKSFTCSGRFNKDMLILKVSG